jgi:hypothetical protein
MEGIEIGTLFSILASRLTAAALVNIVPMRKLIDRDSRLDGRRGGITLTF